MTSLATVNAYEYSQVFAKDPKTVQSTKHLTDFKRGYRLKP